MHWGRSRRDHSSSFIITWMNNGNLRKGLINVKPIWRIFGISHFFLKTTFLLWLFFLGAGKPSAICYICYITIIFSEATHNRVLAFERNCKTPLTFCKNLYSILMKHVSCFMSWCAETWRAIWYSMVTFWHENVVQAELGLVLCCCDLFAFIIILIVS